MEVQEVAMDDKVLVQIRLPREMVKQIRHWAVDNDYRATGKAIQALLEQVLSQPQSRS